MKVGEPITPDAISDETLNRALTEVIDAWGDGKPETIEDIRSDFRKMMALIIALDGLALIREMRMQ